LLQSLVYTVLFACILIHPLGANGVWTAFLLGEVFTLLTVAAFLLVKNRALSLDAVMMLPEDFGGERKDRWELSIGNSMDEVMAISSNIGQFAKGRQIDDKLLNLLSLCVEEMEGNVVQHAFKPGEKRWLDLTIVDKPESVIVRIRDNGRAFDPLAYINGHEAKGYGIQMIHALAQGFEYRRSMGLNNLIISLKK